MSLRTHRGFRPNETGTVPDVDRLAEYRRKRDFDVTPEPSGVSSPPPTGSRFVVQKHRARRLHYDLRLEFDGVLLSWAVPKGPTLDADVRRMAARTEDHPLDYFDFEGVIPAGEYGGGDVTVWDWGTFEHDGPMAKALRKGDLHFDLMGEKLRGRFALVRRGDDDKNWLLIHKHDEFAVSGWDAEDHPRSVRTGRTNDEVRDAPAATWRSHASWAGPNADELAALAALGGKGEWRLGEHTLRLTNLDKVLYSATPATPAFTKRDVIRHYASRAPVLLPYVAGRPVNLRRHPDGVDQKGFWQKQVPDHAPDFVGRWRNAEVGAGETTEYAVLDNAAALAWAANFGAVELHPWTSCAEAPHEPTWALIDIDPGESSTFDDVLVLARLHRVALDRLGVQAVPKVTGQRGIQIFVPVARGTTFDATRAWVEQLSRAIGGVVPDMVSWEWEVARRGGRIRLDYTQNAINKTLVAPFSLRAAPGAPVSVPITWDELDSDDLEPGRWRLPDVDRRLAEAGDPLAPLVGLQQRLPAWEDAAPS